MHAEEVETQGMIADDTAVQYRLGEPVQVTQEATVFVVDDDQAVRKSLEMLLRSVGLRVETFSSGQEFLEAYNPSRAGCLVLDVRMPGMSGLELQRTMRQRKLDVPTIVITGHGDVPVAVRSLKEGAFEFLQKPFSKQILLEHIRDALKRDAERRVQQKQQEEVASRMNLLSARERQVMELVVAGKANKEIAAELGLSKKTIEVHRAHVMQKVKVDTLAELVECVITSRLQSATNGKSS